MLIALLDYSHSKLTSSHYLIFYLILYMYTLIFAYFIFHDLVEYIGWIFYLLEHVDSSMLYDYSTKSLVSIDLSFLIVCLIGDLLLLIFSSTELVTKSEV